VQGEQEYKTLVREDKQVNTYIACFRAWQCLYPQNCKQTTWMQALERNTTPGFF